MNDNILLVIIAISFFIVIISSFIVEENTKIKMAQSGLQECIIDSNKVWRKECQ